MGLIKHVSFYFFLTECSLINFKISSVYCAAFPEPASVRIRPSLVLRVAVYQYNPDDVMEADPSVNHSEDQGAPIAQVLKLG